MWTFPALKIVEILVLIQNKDKGVPIIFFKWYPPHRIYILYYIILPEGKKSAVIGVLQFCHQSPPPPIHLPGGVFHIHIETMFQSHS